MKDSSQSRPINWYLLVLTSLTFALCRMLPMACMPVLFKEIAQDLNLNLVQIGAIWGMIPLGSLFAAPVAGLLSDKFGIKRTIVIFCFLTGLSSAARGLSGDFVTLVIISFLLGMLSSMLQPPTAMAANFAASTKQQGLAQGILMASAGFASVIGAMISATLLSPLLGGWRQVMFLYGGITIVIAMLWAFTYDESPTRSRQHSQSISLTRGLIQVIKIKTVWLVGLIGIAYFGCVQGIGGYLVLYLLQHGWAEVVANGVLATSSAVGAIGTIPLTLISDKIGSRKLILLVALISTAAASILLIFVHNEIVWLLIILFGLYSYLFPALLNTIIFEAQDINPEYKGTAVSSQMALSQVGMFIAPPVGNSLAGINSGVPFLFWAVLAMTGIIALHFLKETGWRSKQSLI